MAGKFELYQDRAGEFRARVKSGDGAIILTTEGYKQRARAENGVESIRKNATNDARYERKKTASGNFMFNLKASNGQVIGTSESYNSASARDDAIEKLKKLVSDARLDYLTSTASDVSDHSHDLGETSPPELPQSDRGQDRMEIARKSGFGLHFKRESQDIVLNAKGFALALARLFKNAEGEFSFALFGRWGSGKTSIANLVSGYLEDPSSYKTDFQTAFNTDSVEGCDQLKYETVHFNAWRYRQKPELWVYLYESFLVKYLDCNIFERIAKTVRVNLHKIGVIQALFSLFVLALAAFPLMWISLIFPYGQAVFGVTGSIGLVLLAYRWKASLRHLYDQYGVIKSHREHLGMQAVIGLDLQVLLTSWSKAGHFKSWENNALGFGSLLVSLAWFSTFFTFDSVSIASIAGWLIWSLVSAVFWISAKFKIGAVDRILLVIDDLDRCPEEEIVDLIDGIKLMIDDESIGKVVQVLVLADDTVLNAAVRRRFKALSPEEDDIRWIEAISEHMEKVFLCHARLQKLTQTNVVDLVDVYSREFGLETLNTDRQDSSETRFAVYKSNNDIQHDGSSAALQTKFVITQEEQAAIREVLVNAFENAESPVTPRFVRSFLYKYQLVRMLLQLNSIGFETSELAHSLAEAVLWTRSSVKPWEPEIVSQTTNYIRMVA